MRNNPKSPLPTILFALCLSMLLAPASRADAPPAPVPSDWLPITYIQSAFFTDSDVTPRWYYPTFEDKKLRARGGQHVFDAGEVLNMDLDTTAGLRDIRDLSRAFTEVSEETGKPFFGFWSFPRMPGFFFPDDIDAQPAAYRACALRADGSLWARRPPPPEDNESRIKFTGEAFDITNKRVVTEVLANIRRVFAADGPEDACVGPINGFIVLNEWTLSGNYESVFSTKHKENDVASDQTVMRLGQRTHRAIWSDDDPYYSYYNPPKRCIPLYTESAARAFVAWAKAQGHDPTKLPADRNEFNDDDATVELPAWVEFVPLDDTERWQLWEDWVYDTWTTFVEDVCRESCLAQQSADDFLGVIYFQLPMWYSLREASREPVTYSWLGKDGVVASKTVVLADYPESAALNAVVMGTDMERLIRSPWIAGVLHETTCSIPIHGLPSSAEPPQHDDYVMHHPRFRHFYMAQGALLKKVCHENGKLFGAFARAQYFMGRKVLTRSGFEKSFRHTVSVLQPDIIATIGPWFVDPEKLPEEYRSVCRGVPNALGDVWLRLQREYKKAYVAPTKR